MILLLSFIQSSIFLVNYVGADCLYYQFKTQPPASLNCNPYITPLFHIFDLKIPCEVEREHSSVNETFDVHWIKREFDGEVTDLGRGKTIFESRDHISTELTITQLVLGDFSLKLSGDYWCQVINTTTVPYTYLGTSNILRILSLEMYISADDGPEGVCRGTKSDDSDTCADIPSKEVVSDILGQAVSTVSSVMPQTSSSKLHQSQSILMTTTKISVIHNSTSVHIPATSNTISLVNVRETNIVTVDEAANDSTLSDIAYILMITMLVLTVSLLTTVVAIMCRRRRKNKTSDGEDAAIVSIEPQPYIEPIQTLRPPERTTTKSISHQHNRSTQESKPINIYASLSRSTMEPRMEYAMVNSSLQSDEFINYEYFRTDELLNPQ